MAESRPKTRVAGVVVAFPSLRRGSLVQVAQAPAVHVVAVAYRGFEIDSREFSACNCRRVLWRHVFL